MEGKRFLRILPCKGGGCCFTLFDFPRLPQHILRAAEARIEHFRMGLHTRPPMPFIQWREYLADLADFNKKIPALAGATPGSPVQDY